MNVWTVIFYMCVSLIANGFVWISVCLSVPVILKYGERCLGRVILPVNFSDVTGKWWTKVDEE